jgi:hypothetical protein
MDILRKIRNGHTSYVICTKLAFAQIIRADMSIDRTGYDIGRTNVDRLDSVAGLFQDLDRLTWLGAANDCS